MKQKSKRGRKKQHKVLYKYKTSLGNIPDEIFIQVLSKFLEPLDIHHLSKVNKHIHECFITKFKWREHTDWFLEWAMRRQAIGMMQEPGAAQLNTSCVKRLLTPYSFNLDHIFKHPTPDVVYNLNFRGPRFSGKTVFIQNFIIRWILTQPNTVIIVLQERYQFCLLYERIKQNIKERFGITKYANKNSTQGCKYLLNGCILLNIHAESFTKPTEELTSILCRPDRRCIILPDVGVHNLEREISLMNLICQHSLESYLASVTLKVESSENYNFFDGKRLHDANDQKIEPELGLTIWEFGEFDDDMMGLEYLRNNR